MSASFLKVKLDNDKIELSSNSSLLYTKTNLPKSSFSFSPQKPLFWELEQKHYDVDSGTLTVNVINYNLGGNSILINDSPKHPITNLKFEKLD
jgi:hypothetical protein